MSTMRGRGNLGEDAVVRYLQAHGYTVLARNFRVLHGELDIVAENETYLCFVEVKTRKATTDTARYGTPASYVDQKKQNHLIAAADTWLSQNPTENYIRFDVAEVYLSGTTVPSVLDIRYMENAFVRPSQW